MNVKRSILSGGMAAAVVATAFALFPSTSTLSPMPMLRADSLNCNLSQYKAAQGLTAAIEQDGLVVSWTGQNGADLRARYGLDSGQPVVREHEFGNEKQATRGVDLLVLQDARSQNRTSSS